MGEPALSRTVYVNGDFLAEEEAKISIFDRGFIFADGIYEVSAVLDGGLVDNEAHLARLARSLGEIDLPMPMPKQKIVALQKELIARNHLVEGSIYLQVTRGAADREFAFPQDGKPSLVMFTQAREIVNDPKATSGIKLLSVPDIRWARRDIKSVALLAQVLAKQAAAAAGCQEAIMHEDGVVTEGGSSTVFIVTEKGQHRDAAEFACDPSRHHAPIGDPSCGREGARDRGAQLHARRSLRRARVLHHERDELREAGDRGGWETDRGRPARSGRAALARYLHRGGPRRGCRFAPGGLITPSSRAA